MKDVVKDAVISVFVILFIFLVPAIPGVLLFLWLSPVGFWESFILMVFSVIVYAGMFIIEILVVS